MDAEALVRFENSLYSVPASFVGHRVSAGRPRWFTVLIRERDCVVAEHPRARVAGTRMEKPEHVRQRWQRSLEPPPSSATHRLHRHLHRRSPDPSALLLPGSHHHQPMKDTCPP